MDSITVRSRKRRIANSAIFTSVPKAIRKSGRM